MRGFESVCLATTFKSKLDLNLSYLSRAFDQNNQSKIIKFVYADFKNFHCGSCVKCQSSQSRVLRHSSLASLLNRRNCESLRGTKLSFSCFGSAQWIDKTAKPFATTFLMKCARIMPRERRKWELEQQHIVRKKKERERETRKLMIRKTIRMLSFKLLRLPENNGMFSSTIPFHSFATQLK